MRGATLRVCLGGCTAVSIGSLRAHHIKHSSSKRSSRSSSSCSKRSSRSRGAGDSVGLMPRCVSMPSTPTMRHCAGKKLLSDPLLPLPLHFPLPLCPLRLKTVVLVVIVIKMVVHPAQPLTATHGTQRHQEDQEA
jgi:hypothetical protein